MTHLKKSFYQFVTCEEGAAAAEYALILAIVGTAIAAAAIILGQTIAGAMTGASDCIKQVTAACDPTPVP